MAKDSGVIRIAFLGCGGMMGRHAQRLRELPDVQIVGLCDVSEDVTRAFEAAHLSTFSPAHFTDPAQMFAELKPDAVFIGTPHTQHFAQAQLALAAGCHIFMEKPMVTSLADAYALEKEVTKSGKVFVIGYNTPCSPEFHYVRETIRSGSLGKLELVGGGQAYDSGAHIFNSLCWSVEKEVEEVFAFVDNHGTRVDINSVSSIRFADGVLANITIGGNCPGGGRFMAFVFDNGRIELDGWEATWMNVWQGDKQLKYPPITADMGALSPDHNFVDAILGRAEPKTSVHNGVIQSQLMDAIYESQRTGLPARPKRY